MTHNYKRTDRVAGTLQRKIAQLIQQEIKDPRLSPFISVTAVKVSADLSHAKVYITCLDDNHAESIKILNSAAGFLRTALSKSLKTRTTPQLHFVYDESVEYGNRISRLIDEVNADHNENPEDE